MRTRNPRLLAVTALALVGAATYAAISLAGPVSLTNVPNANTKSQGFAPASVLSPELQQTAVAQGSTRVENPAVVPGPTNISYYGYDNDTLNAANEPIMVGSSATGNTEAHKTEPDKNVYLIFKKSLQGADLNYNYGTHFLFQGHEGGSPGYITRINLDADAKHRVTVLATKDDQGNDIATIDGVTWDPWAQKLLLTTESASKPTYSATPGFPSTVHDVSGALGRGGYEGIQDDADSNIWIVEDIGGANKPPAGSATCTNTNPPPPGMVLCTKARIPHSYVYRYVPGAPGDLANGKLQVLQVFNAANQLITETSQTPLMSPDQVALHTYGSVFDTKWKTIHDTAVNGTAPFNANSLAAGVGTPFKRPENGLFQPGSHFRTFFFDETGDTDATSPENNCCGGWTGVFKLTQTDPSANSGKLTLFYKGDQAHAGFDNVAFFTKSQIAFVEDAGDTLHTQRNALDSGFLFDANADYSNGLQPLRFLAEGRDASATDDSDNGGYGKNDQDNEITGMHVSNGDTDKAGILGAKDPNVFKDGWRVFWTQQHGDNTTWEVIEP